MSIFKVTSIIDGDTFEVTPKWKWNDETGVRIRPTGYDATELQAQGGQSAKEKLSRLILDKDVDLKKAYKVDRGRLICDVYFQGKGLADYFPEYQ